MYLKGKTAVITGGAIRVGRALTLALAQAGCNVLIHYDRSATPAEETKAEAQKLGAQAHLFSADLRDADSAQAILDAALERFGQVDVLINSAAIFPEDDTFSGTDADLFDTLMSVNLRAPFLLSQAFAAQIPDDGMGKIINVIDARVRQIQTDHFVYRLTKGGLWTMTEMLARELAPRITVNAVALGAILPPPDEDRAYLDRLVEKRVPLGRPGSPEIVAENLLHLLRQDFVTGTVRVLDGGEFV
jgi:glucose 1-dehydrogenase